MVREALRRLAQEAKAKGTDTVFILVENFINIAIDRVFLKRYLFY